MEILVTEGSLSFSMVTPVLFLCGNPTDVKPISTRKCCRGCNFGLSHDLDCNMVQPTCSGIGVSVGGLSHCSGI